MAVFETVGDLGIKFGKDAFMKHLELLFCSYQTNTAASVREMGIQKAEFLAKAFGSSWLAESFVPKIIKVFEEDQMGYNFRMTSIKSLSVVIKYMSKDDVNSMVVPVFAKACGDRVPNVQFCVCQQIALCKSSIDKGTFDS